MRTTSTRTLIAAMQMTLDGYVLGPEGEVDWVDSWADGLQRLPEVDAFILGGGMFPDYEEFWAAVLGAPATAADWIGRDPYPHEVAYAHTAAATPHLVVSTTLRETTWPTAEIVTDLAQLRAFKEQEGKPAYVVGGPGLVASLDVGVMPESNFYGSPLKVIEWMAAAKAVVAPSYAPLTDVIDHGVHGLLFAPGDLSSLVASVIQLIDEPHLRHSLGRAAAARVRAELTWTDNARRVLSACEAARQRHRQTTSGGREGASSHITCG